MATPLLAQVWQDVKAFLAIPRPEPFYNERELQVKMASFLEQTKHYAQIYLEYYVPVQNNKNEVLLPDYPWDSEIRMDIVVHHQNFYIPIELKYKTKKIKEHTITRFGEYIEDVDIIKTQSAQDIGRYDFWKDVKRIEVIKNRYSSVAGGIALFLTNDANYYNEKTRRSSFYNFRLTNDNDGSSMCWENDPKIRDNHPDFHLTSIYSPKWLDKDEVNLPNGIRCYYCLVGG